MQLKGLGEGRLFPSIGKRNEAQGLVAITGEVISLHESTQLDVIKGVLLVSRAALLWMTKAIACYSHTSCRLRGGSPTDASAAPKTPHVFLFCFVSLLIPNFL